MNQVASFISGLNSLTNRARRVGVGGAAVLTLAGHLAIARADLLTAGNRSGSITATADGYNTGPGPNPSTTQTLGVPAAGPGNVSTAVYANPFFVGLGTPPSTPSEQFGIASAAVNLNTVSASSYSLNASAGFGYITGTNSDAVYVSPSYSFDQQIVIGQPVQYTLQMAVTRPTFQYPGDLANNAGDALPIPSETFSGPGVSLSLSAPYYTDIQNPPGSGNFEAAPLSVSQIFTGILEPGTYSFDSNWSAPLIGYDNNYSIDDNEAATVSASLAVSSVPEPASFGLLSIAAGLLGLGRKCRSL